MIELEYFKRPITIDITVATLGVSSNDWYCHKKDMSNAEVIETMRTNEWEIIPIINGKDLCEEYYTLSSEGDLLPKKILPTDRMYYLTHVRDAIWQMNNTKKTHFFLSNNRESNDIVGLLSLSNFNSREFSVFMFSFISFIEKGFASLIISTKFEAFKFLEKCCDTKALKDKLKGISNRIDKDIKNNIVNDYKEYLYLHHLIWILQKEGKYEDLNFKNEEDFSSEISFLIDLRNNIAHPVKSLVKDLKDLDNLEKGLNKLYEYKERLEVYLNRPNKEK